MAFGDVSTPKGLVELDVYLSDRSYVEGYVPTQADLAVFAVLKAAPANGTPHALRWYNHIKSYSTDERKKLPSDKKAPALAKHTAAKPSAKEEDDDVDLFGSDEEEDAEAAKLRDERLKAYSEKKSKKPAVIAKSSIVLDVKPWDDETDMKAMEAQVRTLVKEGLVWGASKLVPVGYGISKLQIMCIVEDDKVGVDDLVEDIQNFEDLVQSVDIAAFNKI